MSYVYLDFLQTLSRTCGTPAWWGKCSYFLKRSDYKKKKKWLTSEGSSSSCSFCSSSGSTGVSGSDSVAVSSPSIVSVCDSTSSGMSGMGSVSVSEYGPSWSVSSPASALSRPSRDSRWGSSPVLLTKSMLSSRERTGVWKSSKSLITSALWGRMDFSARLLRQSISRRERNKAPSIPSRGCLRVSRMKGLTFPVRVKKKTHNIILIRT